MSPSISAPRRMSSARNLHGPHRLVVRIVFAFALTVTLLVVLAVPASADSTPPASAPGETPQSLTDSPAAQKRVLLPLLSKGPSPITTGTNYHPIPVLPPPSDRPAAAHADLNLALRGYSRTSGTLGMVAYGGEIDPNAPQMPGIFADHRTPLFSSLHRVYEWNWGCGRDGCRGDAIANPGVTLLGMATREGELLAAPSRYPQIYGGEYVALVLYADESRLTLKYTRDDNVIGGYTVHLENLGVDSNLLALYRRTDAAGRWELPGVTNGQPLGVASGSEVLVAIRDCGAFMDPRSRKDWWQGR